MTVILNRFITTLSPKDTKIARKSLDYFERDMLSVYYNTDLVWVEPGSFSDVPNDVQIWAARAGARIVRENDHESFFTTDKLRVHASGPDYNEEWRRNREGKWRKR